MKKRKTLLGRGDEVDWDNLKLFMPFKYVKSYYCQIGSRELPTIKIVYNNGWKTEIRNLEIIDRTTIQPAGIKTIIFEKH